MKKHRLLRSPLLATQAFGQAGFPPPPPKVSPAAGVIDMHVHSHPDVFGRNMDDIDVASSPRRKGMRGIVIKNHVSETASRAALVMKVVPGIEVFGGIVLNKAVGGINPDAVEWMHRVYGSRGKVVWLPTFESDKHVKTLRQARRARASWWRPNGQVTPEMEAILKIIARENLLLATGHVHPEEIIAVVRARARARREEHARHPRPHQRARPHHGAGQAGGRHGRGDRGVLPPVPWPGPNAPLAFLTHWTQINAKHVAQAVKEFGAKSLVISSDLGQSSQHDAPRRHRGGDRRDEARGHLRRRHRRHDAQEPGAAARPQPIKKGRLAPALLCCVTATS